MIHCGQCGRSLIVALVRAVALATALDAKHLRVTHEATPEAIATDTQLLERRTRQWFEELLGISPLGGDDFVQLVDDPLLDIAPQLRALVFGPW